MKVIGIVGSPRMNGNTQILTAHALKAISEENYLLAKTSGHVMHATCVSMKKDVLSMMTCFLYISK
jgi:multimeric flavodoxin WrbA